MHEAGYTLTERDPDYVVLGETRIYSFGRITQAIRLIVNGARFIATNPDATGPSNEGPLPATGSVAALISRATGVDPYFVGKPNPFMMRSALQHARRALRDDRHGRRPHGHRRGLRARGRPADGPRAHRRDHARGGRSLSVRASRVVASIADLSTSSAERSDRERRRDEPGLVGEDDGLHAVAQLELAEQAPDVGLDRVLAEHELGGDLGVRQPWATSRRTVDLAGR
jgi:hypothetical protein